MLLPKFYFLLAKVLKGRNSSDFGMVILLDKDLECSFLCCWLHMDPYVLTISHIWHWMDRVKLRKLKIISENLLTPYEINLLYLEVKFFSEKF